MRLPATRIVPGPIVGEAIIRNTIVGDVHCTWPYCMRSHFQQRRCWRRALFAAPLSALNCWRPHCHESALSATPSSVTPLSAMPIARVPIIRRPIIRNALYLRFPSLTIPSLKYCHQHASSVAPLLPIPSSAAPLLVIPIVHGHIVCGQIIRDADYSRRPSSTQRRI